MHLADSKLWAIVLAGGRGTRLASLTRALYGRDVPKQYAVLAGERSLLQMTVERIGPLVPPERTVVVASRDHHELARRQLAAYRGVEVLSQPVSRDTGPGLILPIAHIRARDPSARIVVLPADHYFARPAALIDAIELAETAALLGNAPPTLLGAEPDEADTQYGWILPGRSLGRCGMRRVGRFVEKPVQRLAESLLERGALWNTFIMIASAESLWRLSCEHLPQHAARIDACVRGSADLETTYATMEPANFSHDVLEPARQLAVLPLRGAGWSDWGTPRRVFESLRGTDDHRALLRRIQAPGRATAMVA